MGCVRPVLAFIPMVWTFIFVVVSYYLSFRVQVISEQLSEKYTTLVGVSVAYLAFMTKDILVFLSDKLLK
jgi:hypothetical protein